MPRSSRRKNETTLALVAALATVAVVGGAWRLDARRRRGQAKRLHRMLVDVLLNALTAGDPVTARHSRRVANLTDVLASAHGLDRPARATLRVASLLHDMGKIDDKFFDIIHSCTPLTHRQREEIKEHPQQSSDILEPLEQIHPGIMRIVESHHECWDGKGYPHGLERDEIPLGARMISVADVFDALTEPRTYREALPLEEALAEIRKAAGSKFDPEVVALLEQPAVRAAWEREAAAGREQEERLIHEGSDESVVATSGAG